MLPFVLKIYESLIHLLTEIPKHMDKTSLEFLEGLLPWFWKLPEACRKQIHYETPNRNPDFIMARYSWLSVYVFTADCIKRKGEFLL